MDKSYLDYIARALHAVRPIPGTLAFISGATLRLELEDVNLCFLSPETAMEPLEEGQIPDKSADTNEYSPSFEWPAQDGIGEAETSTAIPRRSQPTFRLVVLRSSILPSKQKVAVIDSHHEAQLGRDAQLVGSVTPRIRLKEMEVSKLHATVYWDGSRKEWNVVDMGSKHGTFLHSGAASPDSDDMGVRLSQPRCASIPRRLRHGDKLSIGSTTLAVHIHDNQRPCEDCTVFGTFEIPLFPSTQKRTREVAGLETDGAGSVKQLVERDHKKTMSMLKRSLLASLEGPENMSNVDYVDRAARRRMLHTSSRPDSPGVPNLSATNAARDTKTPTPLPKAVVSQPPTPLPASNIGHRLLVRQGWAPGTCLGVDSSGSRIEPLDVKSNPNRAGLGL